ncbi:Pyridoxal 5'-phosphate synthase subunit SNO1 [Candida viswanathii]|uniref:Pyridoxal 5'-phosphate synthase glutaminase subunit n=1 Tax=Candida viswanathii TaxID=5486 RepID=A0A367XRA9_9ASCO|nr:Pyridoxal 5'-phosphate synthase subunit SNO1 [Candida viswanathii]
MTTTKPVILGVLALQGAFREHIAYFKHLIDTHPTEYSAFDFHIIEVRTKEDLELCDALVIPGGESSSMSYIAERTQLLPELYKFVADESKSVWGTCAGLIFLSKHLINGIEQQKTLGALDIEVSRNAFGRQIDSFEQHLDFSSFIPGCTDFPTVFIRAPIVTKILDKKDQAKEGVLKSENTYQNKAPVELLYSLKNYDGKDNELIVAVKQGHVLGTSFHPELADDYRFHKWFLDDFVLKRVIG